MFIYIPAPHPSVGRTCFRCVFLHSSVSLYIYQYNQVRSARCGTFINCIKYVNSWIILPLICPVSDFCEGGVNK